MINQEALKYSARLAVIGYHTMKYVIFRYGIAVVTGRMQPRNGGRLEARGVRLVYPWSRLIERRQFCEFQQVVSDEIHLTRCGSRVECDDVPLS